MLYPLAPWILRGNAFQTLQWAEISKVRSHIPAELEIVPFLPGKTLAGIYLARYHAGSTLEYSELIVVAAYVRYAGQSGAWISHIYVDQPASVAGGRAIWSLPKELADFNWETSDSPIRPDRQQVTVRQQQQLLCRLEWSWQLPLWPQGLSVSSFCTLDPSFSIFDAKSRFKLHLLGASLEIRPESPFASLHLGRPWLAIAAQELNLVVEPPQGLKS
ncbi:MAG: acetoacetate decarboxylase family protein [Aphanocapsa sp. GSE-SYN-MK-11-07L]|jgi:hypothetical protein|nr:acetoacetate decarboxylase family protein [Aphanocapsa sp. GSE-SYN-MK-11-07L]